jgi:hypothetical protein
MNSPDAPLSADIQAIRLQIERCRGAPVDEGKQAFASATSDLVRVRNQRLAAASAGGAGRDPGLRKLDALLSLMASIEFPMAGFHRDRIDQVIGGLEGLGQYFDTGVQPAVHQAPG